MKSVKHIELGDNKLKNFCFTNFILASCVLVLAAINSPATAQEQILARYTANIGPEDHFNSRGQRLTTFAALIAQDRANFHRFGTRHQWDEADPIFSSRKMRAQIRPSLMRIHSAYRPFVRNVLASGGAGGTFMIVIIHGYGNTITGISIDVPG